ncbi:hypothetical protein LFZ56_08975 [Salmonella bongori serovar 66:z41:- str. SA19983605]|uniref:Uncharacterized protein n=1 Tax=Salmonella bongori serovar 66:z41:- str. SA19983605 TaxID=1243617 RepID=A0A248K8H3_SALBN|nr:hypothetical protein LFZ56_08975 [Salmonella bongori serovar 66:z41:- str. SA19983605]
MIYYDILHTIVVLAHCRKAVKRVKLKNNLIFLQ